MNLYCISTLIIAVLLSMCNVNGQNIRFDTENIANGEYYYEYKNGLYSKDETGSLDSEGNSVVTGQYRYVLNGKEYVVTYTADKDGYHPKVTVFDTRELELAYSPPPASASYDPNLVASLLG